MKNEDILIKDPFGNHTKLSSLKRHFENILNSTDKMIYKAGPGSTCMNRDDWLKAAENNLKKFIHPQS